MSTQPESQSTKSPDHHRKCKCLECSMAFHELVLSQVFTHGFTSTGAIRERLGMMGQPAMPNDIRSVLWSLQSKPNQRVEVSRRGNQFVLARHR